MTAEKLPNIAGATDKKPPLSQGKERQWRKHVPTWMQQLPYLNLPAADESFSLVNRVEMRKKILAALGEGFDESIIAMVDSDLDLLERELMPLFKEVDTQARMQQNRYRLIQIGFIFLALVATIIGSLLTLALRTSPNLVPVLAFLETVIALLATYLATVSSRRPAMAQWVENRRIAEALRREYFRFLVDLAPYDSRDGYERQMLLSKRAAEIYQGTYPDDGTSITQRPMPAFQPPIQPPPKSSLNDAVGDR